MQRYARNLGTPILFGAYGYEMVTPERAVTFNSAFLVRPDRFTDYQYDKRFLVPVVERVPLLNPSWFGDLRYFGGLGIGEGWPLAEAAGTRFGALICYESSYAEGSRRFRREGADVLVNITNDSWYGRQPWWARTTALWQHPAHMVMRAIENRVGVARAANTGISMFIDPVGRTYSTLGLFNRGFRTDVVYTTDVTTFYTRTGDLVGNGAALTALLLLAWAWLRGRGKRPPPGLEAG
jgi:apolipoprotein N-acyltransferase